MHCLLRTVSYVVIKITSCSEKLCLGLHCKLNSNDVMAYQISNCVYQIQCRVLCAYRAAEVMRYAWTLLVCVNLKTDFSHGCA